MTYRTCSWTSLAKHALKVWSGKGQQEQVPVDLVTLRSLGFVLKKLKDCTQQSQDCLDCRLEHRLEGLSWKPAKLPERNEKACPSL